MKKEKRPFPKIIFRYIGKEVVFTMLAVTLIVAFIFLCNQFVHYLTYVASGKYAITTLFHLIILQAPILIGYLLPLGLFLGVLLSFGRLYADSEMTVLYACGFSRKQLLWMVFSISFFVMIVVAFLVLWFNPIFALKRDKMIDAAEASTVFQTILPGHFQSTKDGKRVFYIERMSRDRSTMHNVFVAQQSESGKSKTGNLSWMILSARRGYQMTDKDNKENYMVTTNGYRFSGVPGQKDYEIIKFDKYGVQMQASKLSKKNEGEEAIPTMKLISLAFTGKNYMAELQWRLAMPISVLLLGLLAVPLSYVKPRQGRFAHLIPAILCYFVYVNMIFVSRSWIEGGTIPSWIGIWWVHIAMLALVMFFIARFTGWRFSRKKLSDENS